MSCVERKTEKNTYTLLVAVDMVLLIDGAVPFLI
jgi:hypothetical protein